MAAMRIQLFSLPTENDKSSPWEKSYRRDGK
jgi:hypothetical protein